jgi:hypothetical protein
MSQVEIKLLPDGTGRVKIHYFARDEAAPETPSKSVQTNLGAIKLGGTKGYLACRRAMPGVTPQVIGGVVLPFPHSDDPRAVTCPDCQKTAEYKKHVAMLGETGEVVTSTE